MPTLTKANAKYHCRTCLLSLKTSDYDEFPHDIPRLNLEMESLLQKYVADVCGYDDCPERVCRPCFRKLEDFDKFCNKAKESWHKLRTILEANARVTKIELDYDEANDGRGSDEPAINNEDIYKLFLKDSLMETETVMLDHTAGGAIEGVDMQDPDPFEATALMKMDSREDENNEEANGLDWPSNEESFSDQEDDEEGDVRMACGKMKEGNDDDEIEDNSSPDDECLRKPHTRCTKLSARHKKKRRTKKEMSETVLEPVAKHDHTKIKRRNKGTRNTFKCSQCNHCFAHKITLDAHVRKVHEGSKRPFQCDRCDKAYTFIGGLYTHIKEIHDTAERSYTCDHPGCGRNYTSFIAMQKHKRLKHSDQVPQKKYVCEQCGSTFNQSGNLKHHRRTKHPTEAEQAEREKSTERFECEICKKHFHSRYTLKYHTLQLHSHDTKYECTVCGRRMAKKFMLVQHMLVHSKDKMPCEHCGKQFIRKFELEAHIRAVHMKLKPFECQYCSECFASRKTLRHHEYIHTGEKPYVCDVCGQAYRQQTCLKNHRKSHEKLSADAVLMATAHLNRSLMHNFMGAGLGGETQVGGGNVGPPVIVEPPPPPDDVGAMALR